MTDMEGIERRSESPSTRASSRLSNLSNQDMVGDSEVGMRRKSPSRKQKSRSIDKENGEMNPGTNGDINGSDDQHENHNGGDTEMIEVNVVTEIEQNGEESNRMSDKDGVETEKTRGDGESNGNVEEGTSENGDAHGDEDQGETSQRTEEVSPRGSGNESMNAETEESYCTAEGAQTDRTESAELNTTEDNADSESDREKENGFDGGKIDVKITGAEAKTAEEDKGFFGNWSFSLTSSKKETNGHAEDVNTSQLYYSSIRGRVPLSRGSPNMTIIDKDTVIMRGLKTPSTTRNLNDSFGVKSEPSRMTRIESRDRPNLRKFPAKRCLNADETDEKEDSFLSNLTFAKRRKLNDDKNRTGFLRSFLWSPFRKRSEEDRSLNEPDDKGTLAKASWFRSPFWFWKRCNNNNNSREETN